MRTALVVPAAPLAKLVDRARGFAADGRAGSTKKAYRANFRSFEAWCSSQGVAAMPARPELVALYATALADVGRRVSTIERAVTAIAQVHRSHGVDWSRSHPALTEVLAGIRRRLGTAPLQKAPVVDQKLIALLAAAGDGLAGDRDRALLSLGWFGAFRRAELVSLDAGDIVRGDEGLVATLRRSKGDQEGRGAIKGIPFASLPAVCSVRALARWLEASSISERPIFREIDRHGHLQGERLHPSSVARIVKRCAERAGLDPEKFAGHSLRAGFATTAAKRGKSLDAIMRQTLPRSERVARTYIRHAKLFDDNAAGGLF
jgi:site-specific recombinase XerD